MTAPQQRRRRTRAETGEEVLRHLIAVAPAGLTRAELIERMAPAYSPSQVYLGTLWVKETGASREGRPYAWSRTQGHRFPDDPEDALSYATSQARRAYNALDRMLRSTIDPLRQQGWQDPRLAILYQRINDAAREIGTALEEMKHPPLADAQTPTPA